ncbi:ABC transporter substrate-binding protein [Paenibacillus sp. y28]|uniref:ABC transporter substrate-binding protein n=1 Tax=Paenibacillus sp. y28 TaxID=3129110 RepID=UPI003015AF44
MKKAISIGILAFTLLLSACSSNAPSAGTGGEAVAKDLVVASGADAVKLDPQDSTDSISNNVIGLIFDKLVTFDNNNNIVPQLAKEWTLSPDGMKLTFKLVEGAKFQDDAPVNAEAVKITFDRVLNKDNKLARYNMFSQFIDQVVVDSEYQVTFQLKFPYKPALATFTHAAGSILSPKSVKENSKNIAKAPVGSGPYKLKEWVQGEKLVLEPSPNFWGEKPKLQTITFKAVPENAARSLMLETGEADLILPVPVADIDRLKGNDKVQVTEFASNRNLYIGINAKKAPFDNVKVRQAMNYAVDKETIAKKILMGQGKVLQSAIAEKVWGFAPVGAYPYDPEKAKQLLAEAGFKEGTTVNLWTSDGRYLMDRQIAEFVQGNLQAVGFKVEFRKWDFGALLSELGKPEASYDLYLSSASVPANDAEYTLSPSFASNGAYNYGKVFANADVDALLIQGVKAANDEERKKIYKDALQTIKDQAPWIFLVEFNYPVGARKEVQGYHVWNTENLDLRDAVKK